MFKATYTQETLPPLLQYLASLGRSGTLTCHMTAGTQVVTLTLDRQRILTCLSRGPSGERYGLEAFQQLLSSGGECLFEEGTLPPLAEPRSLLALGTEQLLLRALTAQDIQSVAHIRPYTVPHRAPGQAAPPDRVLDAVDGQRSVQELAHLLDLELEDLRARLAQFEAQQWVSFQSGPVLSADTLAQFTRELTILLGPVTRILIRDALAALGFTAETVPVKALPEFQEELLRVCPVNHHAQVRTLVQALSAAGTPEVRPPFQLRQFTEQLTLLIGPIAQELVSESLQKIRAPGDDLPPALIPSFLNTLQTLLPPTRRAETTRLLHRFQGQART